MPGNFPTSNHGRIPSAHSPFISARRSRARSATQAGQLRPCAACRPCQAPPNTLVAKLGVGSSTASPVSLVVQGREARPLTGFPPRKAGCDLARLLPVGSRCARTSRVRLPLRHAHGSRGYRHRARAHWPARSARCRMSQPRRQGGTRNPRYSWPTTPASTCAHIVTRRWDLPSGVTPHGARCEPPPWGHGCRGSSPRGSPSPGKISWIRQGRIPAVGVLHL